MARRNKFSWWKAGAVVGVVAILVTLTFAVIPYYAVTWTIGNGERESTTYTNKTTYGNFTYDPDTGLPTTVARTGENYHIDDDYDREFVVDAFSSYDVDTYSAHPDAPSGGTPHPQFAIKAYLGNKTDPNKTALEGAAFDVRIVMPGGDKVANTVAWAIGLAILTALAVAIATGGLGTPVAVAAVVGAIGGASVGYYVSGDTVTIDAIEADGLTTNADGWAAIAWDSHIQKGDCAYTASVSLNDATKATYLGFKNDIVVAKGEAAQFEILGDGRIVFIAYLLPGNSDTFIFQHQKTYRDEVEDVKERCDNSSWAPGSFGSDANISAVDTSGTPAYNSWVSTHAGGKYVEIESRRKLTMADPLPANFEWVGNISYGAGPMVALHSGEITHISGTEYELHWTWTSADYPGTPFQVSIHPQIRYTTDNWVSENYVWIGNETVFTPKDIYKVRWRYTWNNPEGGDFNRITYDRELRPCAIYNLQAPLYYNDTTNVVTSKEFISEINRTSLDAAQYAWWYANYGRYPYQTDGQLLMAIYDNMTNYYTASTTYDLTGNDLLKVGWDVPIGNLSQETSYGMALGQAPYDYTLHAAISPTIFGEALYFTFSDWMNFRTEVVDLKALLDTYFPIDINQYQVGNEAALKTLLVAMATKMEALKDGTQYLIDKYAANDDANQTLEYVGFFEQMYAQAGKLLDDNTGIQIKADSNLYFRLRLLGYECLDTYQMSFGQFSAFVLWLKGENQARWEYNILVEVWKTTVIERYQYLMKDINLDALRTIALGLALMVSMSIIGGAHFAYVKNTRYWNKDRKNKMVIVLVYLIFGAVATYALYAFVFIPLVEWWFGVVLLG